MDLGASRRGVDMGPSAVRYAQLREKLRKFGIEHVEDHGNLHVPDRESANEHAGDASDRAGSADPPALPSVLGPADVVAGEAAPPDVQPAQSTMPAAASAAQARDAAHRPMPR